MFVWCVAEPATDTHFVFLEIPVPVEPAVPARFNATNGDRCSEFMAVEQGLMHGATTPRATVRMFCWAGYWRYNDGADPECRAPQTVLAGPSGVLDINAPDARYCATRIIDQYRITCFAVGTSQIGAEATSESVVAWRMRQGHAW